MKRYMGIAPPMVLDVDVLALLLRNNAEYDGTRHSLRNPVLASKIPWGEEAETTDAMYVCVLLLSPQDSDYISFYARSHYSSQA